MLKGIGTVVRLNDPWSGPGSTNGLPRTGEAVDVDDTSESAFDGRALVLYATSNRHRRWMVDLFGSEVWNIESAHILHLALAH